MPMTASYFESSSPYMALGLGYLDAYLQSQLPKNMVYFSPKWKEIAGTTL